MQSPLLENLLQNDHKGSKWIQSRIQFSKKNLVRYSSSNFGLQGSETENPNIYNYFITINSQMKCF